jgi:nucleoporin SEH1
VARYLRSVVPTAKYRSAWLADEIQLQWLPPTIYPNILTSLGIDGRWKLWVEDDTAAPGRRFSSRGSSSGKAAFESKGPGRFPYRSFSIKHNEETRHTYIAFLAADGHLSVVEAEEPESLTEQTKVDEFQALPRPGRGEETCFKVRFDPNPEPCYTALRAGVPLDSLSLIVAGLNSARIFRTRDTVAGSFGAATRAREFSLAADIQGHKSLVRDVAWAPGNFRGYDIVATACQDGFVRVFRVDTPFDKGDGRTWAAADVTGRQHIPEEGPNEKGSGGNHHGTKRGNSGQTQQQQAHHHSGIRAEIDKSGAQTERTATGQPGQVEHTVRELSKLDTHRSPVWRVGFDDDGQILGSVGDEGKLVCFRQKPDGTWAKSSELGTADRTKMVVP